LLTSLSLDRVDDQYLPDYYFHDGCDDFPWLLADSWQTELKKQDIRKLFPDRPIVKVFERTFGEYIKLYIRWQDNTDYPSKSSKILITLNQGYVSVLIFSIREEAGREIAKELRKLIPVAPYAVKDEIKLKVKFWYNPSNQMVRTLDMVEWEKISNNYSEKVSTNLDQLMHLKPEDINAKLLLWFGPPGTGKSYALHALAYEWREWCKFEFITDPDSFFSNPAYMMRVILDSEDMFNPNMPVANADDDYYAAAFEEDGEEEDDDKKPWRLLILEDAGELIQIDSKEKQGQILSRLLNTVDGFIGQGLKVMVLITTNELFKNLNEAAGRAGRCLSKVEFNVLSIEEANKWLGDGSLTRPAILADLYAKKADPDYKMPLPKEFGGLNHSHS